jgi:hypothetical protein
LPSPSDLSSRNFSTCKAAAYNATKEIMSVALWYDTLYVDGKKANTKRMLVEETLFFLTVYQNTF